MTGYVIQSPGDNTDVRSRYGAHWGNYNVARDQLEAALMSPGPGRLVDPYNPALSWDGYNGAEVLFMCERYSIVEDRQKGGFASIEMSFVEAGVPGNTFTDVFSAAAVQQIMLQTLLAASAQLNQQLAAANTPGASLQELNQFVGQTLQFQQQ